MSTPSSIHAGESMLRDARARRHRRQESPLPSRSWLCITTLLLLISLPSSGVVAQTIHAAEIAAASQRFGIPEAWIRAVMRAESAGDRSAVSHRGAMGLMQLMPATWAGLRAQHGFGADPFMPQDNILAGTAYLREMLDRFGSVPLMLAAYNAGPRRVEMHLATGQPLPAETRAYVATLAPLLTGDAGIVASSQIAVRAVRGADGVFVQLRRDDMARTQSIFVPVGGATIAADTPPAQPFVGTSRAAEVHEADGPARHRGSIFAIRRNAGGSP